MLEQACLPVYVLNEVKKNKSFLYHHCLE